jgi:Tfp pilus assembly protein PilN
MRRDGIRGLLTRIDNFGRAVWKILLLNLTEGFLRPKRTFIISIEKGRTCVIYASAFLRRIRIKGVKNYIINDRIYQAPQALASAVVAAREELRPKRASTILTIPFDWALVRTAEFPSTVKANIGAAVGYELDRLTPLSMESAYYDFKVLGEVGDRLNIAIAVARSNLIDGYLQELKETGINVERVTMNLSCFGALCRYLDGDSDLIFASADSENFEGGLLRGGVLTSSFVGSFSGVAHSHAKELANALNPVIALAQDPAPRIVLFPKDGRFAGLEQHVNRPVKTIDQKDLKDLLCNATDDGFSETAIGGVVEALRSEAEPYDLLTRGVRAKAKTPVGVAVGLIILILATSLPYTLVPLQREKGRLAKIDRQIATRRDEVKKVEALRKEVKAWADEIATINRFKDSKPSALVMLKEVTSILPKTVWATRTRMTETTFEIEGYARSTSDLLARLEQSKHLRKVEYSSATTRDARMDSERFVIKMEIEGFDKEETEKKPKDEEKK